MRWEMCTVPVMSSKPGEELGCALNAKTNGWRTSTAEPPPLTPCRRNSAASEYCSKSGKALSFIHVSCRQTTVGMWRTRSSESCEEREAMARMFHWSTLNASGGPRASTAADDEGEKVTPVAGPDTGPEAEDVDECVAGAGSSLRARIMWKRFQCFKH
eukprot:6490462-Amphidinium_carterae.1